VQSLLSGELGCAIFVESLSKLKYIDLPPAPLEATKFASINTLFEVEDGVIETESPVTSAKLVDVPENVSVLVVD
tara:strand:- start:1541 stop:1765 length:225 start_codon:yes stop_codon:yes gene_type:complete